MARMTLALATLATVPDTSTKAQSIARSFYNGARAIIDEGKAIEKPIARELGVIPREAHEVGSAVSGELRREVVGVIFRGAHEVGPPHRLAVGMAFDESPVRDIMMEQFRKLSPSEQAGLFVGNGYHDQFNPLADAMRDVIAENERALKYCRAYMADPKSEAAGKAYRRGMDAMKTEAFQKRVVEFMRSEAGARSVAEDLEAQDAIEKADVLSRRMIIRSIGQ
jgi:hypothetical protein